jgi:hypothetical protein
VTVQYWGLARVWPLPSIRRPLQTVRRRLAFATKA